jgi:nitrate reductase gamma subunit
MRVLLALGAVVVLGLVPWIGAGPQGAQFLFGVVIPYAAGLILVGGMIYRVVGWARSPVPFRIPTTCGQQASLSWIRSDRLDNPHDTLGVVGRMALEILLFRSLFRNSKAELHDGPKVVYGATRWLWLSAIAFHYSMLIVLLRHLRFFTEPVPVLVDGLAALDGFLVVGVPTLYITSVVLLLALTYLLLRRLAVPQLRYISLASDYFPLFLLLGIGTTGVLLRHFVRTDVIAVKQLALSLIRLQPAVPVGLHWLFFVHLFLVCSLFAYLPFSKLVHMAGVFLSPTRNLANNSRAVRHVNPWAKPAKIHTYAAYEDDFRDRMKAAGIPVDKE